jgi:hypothetical protein
MMIEMQNRERPVPGRRKTVQQVKQGDRVRAAGNRHARAGAPGQHAITGNSFEYLLDH